MTFEEIWEDHAYGCIVQYWDTGGVSPELTPQEKKKLIDNGEWDGTCCPTCGQKMHHYPGELFGEERGDALTISHGISRKLFGGTNDQWNLRPSCNWCNRADGRVVETYLRDTLLRVEERFRVAKWSMSLDYEDVCSESIHPELHHMFLTERGAIEQRNPLKVIA